MSAPGHAQRRPLSPESLTPAALIDLARKTMATQAGFQGHGFTFEVGAGIWYGDRSGQLHGQGPSGLEYVLLPDQGLWFSEDGIHWSDHPEAWASGQHILFLPEDPRVVLAYALTPHEVSPEHLKAEGEEVPEHARVLAVRLDAKRLLHHYFRSRALLKISLSGELPAAHSPDWEALRRLGYQLPAEQGPEMPVVWLTKENFWIEFRQATAPSEAGLFRLEAQVLGTDRVTPELERAFREVLAAYGAEPTDWALARLEPQQFTLTPIPEEIETFLRARLTWLWIDLTTGRVTRMAQFSPPGGKGQLAFTYDEPVHLKAPEEALPLWKAQALSDRAENQLRALGQLVRDYQQQHARFPDTLTPEALHEFLASEQRPWPTNPFTGRSMREAEHSPGDYTYHASGDGTAYELWVYGWDRSVGGSSFRPQPPLPPGTVVSPAVASPGGSPVTEER